MWVCLSLIHGGVKVGYAGIFYFVKFKRVCAAASQNTLSFCGVVEHIKLGFLFTVGAVGFPAAAFILLLGLADGFSALATRVEADLYGLVVDLGAGPPQASGLCRFFE